MARLLGVMQQEVRQFAVILSQRWIHLANTKKGTH
jgi:hypothetical protein